MRIIDVNQDNVSETGFFCCMSKRKSAGYRRKLRWLEARFAEGLRIRMLDLSQGGRGFIEYIPGEYAWRPVEAAGYLFIHCLWIVGKSKGKGFAKLLLDECIADARRQGRELAAWQETPSSSRIRVGRHRSAFLRTPGQEVRPVGAALVSDQLDSASGEIREWTYRGPLGPMPLPRRCRRIRH